MDAFGDADAGALVAAGAVRERVRRLVELWARRAALELAPRRGARLSAVRELWDRCGFFVFIEPLGNGWIGADLSPEHPLTASLVVPRESLATALPRLVAEGFVDRGADLAAWWTLRPGTSLEALAAETFPELWRRWELCRSLAA